mmetsp:Transcript_10600/g.25097  ORF Transcript_10600/g.25097 Transcript_10600/m.25097 type:complete len:80 (-) Transcript_10600:556-795(-)|eukprot:CAMPEP_0172386890 /NCGR_PEP_ID=MMETSP1061-20121228/4341_1 /TAXON_ID=37318 /ORGANISM="Pseudo-nitzschia pungens, Strain cf. pungens" /LENGTH=79 /DNA_ID=CAMNT_0013116409 /DNA_START=518 /DNA_END=757 /DNA_ORIENTATION=-
MSANSKIQNGIRDTTDTHENDPEAIAVEIPVVTIATLVDSTTKPITHTDDKIGFNTICLLISCTVLIVLGMVWCVKTLG